MAIPSFEEVRELMLAAMSGFFPDANLNKHGDLYKRISITALGITDANYNTEQVFLDLMVDTARGSALDRHGAIYKLERKGSVGAAGSEVLRVFGDGGTVTIGDLLVHAPSGLVFEVRSGGTIGVDGFIDVDIAAVSTGLATNLEADQELQFSTTPANVEQTAVLIGDLEGGLDQELDSAYRERLLTRIANPISGGSRSDWEQWALESADYVASSYVYPNRNGSGTVDIAPLKSGTGSARLLNATERAEVLTYLEDLRPITSTVRVLEVITEATNVEVKITPEAGSVYAIDWDDSTPPEVLLYTSATRLLQFSSIRPGDMKAGDRIIIDDDGGDGSEFVIESLFGTDSVILTKDLGFTPTATSSVYSGSPITASIRENIISLFDAIGTANPPGNNYGNWEGSLRISRLFEVIQTTEGVLDSSIVVPIKSIDAADAGFPDNASVGLLVPGKIIIRGA